MLKSVLDLHFLDFALVSLFLLQDSIPDTTLHLAIMSPEAPLGYDGSQTCLVFLFVCFFLFLLLFLLKYCRFMILYLFQVYNIVFTISIDYIPFKVITK